MRCPPISYTLGLLSAGVIISTPHAKPGWPLSRSYPMAVQLLTQLIAGKCSLSLANITELVLQV